MELKIHFFVKNKHIIAGVGDGIRIKHHIRAVIDPADIAHVRLFAGKGHDREIIKRK